MRYLKAYKWNDVLEEEVPKTLIGLRLIKKEKDMEQEEYNKLNTKKPI